MPDTAAPIVTHHFWHNIYKAVEQLSMTQTAVIGGVGSTASAVSVLSVSDSWLQYFTIAMGAIGACLSVGLLVMKFIQQRREMAQWRADNKAAHQTFTAAHTVSAIDREELHEEAEDLHHRINELEAQCEICGHRRKTKKEPHHGR